HSSYDHLFGIAVPCAARSTTDLTLQHEPACTTPTSTPLRLRRMELPRICAFWALASSPIQILRVATSRPSALLPGGGVGWWHESRILVSLECVNRHWPSIHAPPSRPSQALLAGCARPVSTRTGRGIAPHRFPGLRDTLEAVDGGSQAALRDDRRRPIRRRPQLLPGGPRMSMNAQSPAPRSQPARRGGMPPRPSSSDARHTPRTASPQRPAPRAPQRPAP